MKFFLPALAQSISHDQRPAVYNEARGNFYFFGPTTVQVQGGTSTADPETQTWSTAERVNTLSAYQDFLDAYPRSRYGVAAKIAMDALMRTQAPTSNPATAAKPLAATHSANDDSDTALWKAVEQGASAEDYGVYLQQYPKGKYAALAKQRIKKIEDQVRAKTEAEEQAAWTTAESTQTPEAYQAYTDQYPSGKYSALAKTRVNQLKAQAQTQAEIQDWEQSRSANSADAYTGYLSRYPQGRYVGLAKVAQERLKREAADKQKQETARVQREQRDEAKREEEQSWSKAESATDSATVQAYLTKYPNGAYVKQARTKLAKVVSEAEPFVESRSGSGPGACRATLMHKGLH